MDENSESRLRLVEQSVSSLQQDVAVMANNQNRMHDDLRELSDTVKALNKNLEKLNTFITNKQGFFAGVITTFAVVGSLVGAVLANIWDKIFR